MIKLPQRLWDVVHDKIPKSGHLTAKIIPQTDSRIYCAIDAQQQRHVLIRLAQGEDEITDQQSRGICVETRPLTLEDGEEQKYIDILCLDSSGYEAFNLLAEEIALLLIEKKWSPIKATSRVLAKWRRFWGKFPVHILSREEQMGLFAELHFMEKWLIPRMGVEAVIKWCGPWGKDNDFKFETFNVEVKSTATTHGRVYQISSIDQLALPSNGALLFFGMQLDESSEGKENLALAVRSAQEACSEDASALDHLENGLARIGYSDQYEYKELRFDILEERLFEVRDDFPRLTADTCQVPLGVERVRYDINLDAFDSLVLAKEPSEWSP